MNLGGGWGGGGGVRGGARAMERGLRGHVTLSGLTRQIFHYSWLTQNTNIRAAKKIYIKIIIIINSNKV